MYRLLSDPQTRLSPDTIVLLTAMKLHCVQKESTPEVYDVAKRCYAYVESRSILSVRLLQASLLIALYEIANAIYPAAYLTVGHSARVGHALGIHDRKRAPQLIPSVGTHTRTQNADTAKAKAVNSVFKNADTQDARLLDRGGRDPSDLVGSHHSR
jgi:hypothetical protein